MATAKSCESHSLFDEASSHFGKMHVNFTNINVLKRMCDNVRLTFLKIAVLPKEMYWLHICLKQMQKQSLDKILPNYKHLVTLNAMNGNHQNNISLTKQKTLPFNFLTK